MKKKKKSEYKNPIIVSPSAEDCSNLVFLNVCNIGNFVGKSILQDIRK